MHTYAHTHTCKHEREANLICDVEQNNGGESMNQSLSLWVFNLKMKATTR